MVRTKLVAKKQTARLRAHAPNPGAPRLASAPSSQAAQEAAAQAAAQAAAAQAAAAVASAAQAGSSQSSVMRPAQLTQEAMLAHAQNLLGGAPSASTVRNFVSNLRATADQLEAAGERAATAARVEPGAVAEEPLQPPLPPPQPHTSSSTARPASRLGISPAALRVVVLMSRCLVSTTCPDPRLSTAPRP